MQDFLLVLILLATFIFGWFLMEKVDILLEEWQKTQTELPETDRICYNIDSEGRTGRKVDGAAKAKPGSAIAGNR